MTRLPMNGEKRQGLAWCAASIALVTLAQLALKWSVGQLPSLSPEMLPRLLEAGFRLPFALLAAGVSAYALSMACWFFALRRLPLSYAYPLLSLSYVLVYLLAAVLPWFGETATLFRTAGVALIVFGVRLIHTAGK